MERKRYFFKSWWIAISMGLALVGGSGILLADEQATSYKPVAIKKTFDEVKQQDIAAKPNVTKHQKTLLEQRYELQDQPSKTITMSAGKPVQEGVRVKLPEGTTWEQLAAMTAEEIKQRDLFPQGFRPLPHPKHNIGGQVYPPNQIEAIQKAEGRDLSRFDVEFDLPEHFLPEFPPPVYLTTHPELGDVSRGEVLTIKNYYRLLNGIITPVQMEGLRLLLTPFPQQEFNQTEDRKVKEPTLGVTCLDCHVNGHTNAAFHLNPDTRPQENRFRLDTVSLRGMYNQQIHGSKRSLRSVEDFSQFEQRTAYFDGDHVIAAKKGVHLPNRTEQVAMMAQMQNMFDFPPAPKLDATGRLIPATASEKEQRGEKLFFGKGKCSVCHIPPAFLDHQMHDLHLERFYEPEKINHQYNVANGPIKTFTLRGIKDSPPYLADGRLLTLADTVEFFNLVLQLDLTSQEKEDLLSYLYAL
ncbi:cytochrome b6 [Nitrosococcus watsonii]|uniref:Cytochrome c Hsc n=1 Tax=Nitrosococcus watsoni (strain C-113) TaxID=105559 RepID=D8KA33_NITWC|nr:cytochrome b6 [Nitrosococcus watsonii]ADJ29391.1 cytochrome c Hsc [Nitrosococcus watsonii C-113]